MIIIDKINSQPLARYLIPFLVFMVLTELQRFGSATSVFWIYALKASITGLLLFIFFRRRMKEVPGKWLDGTALLIGLAVLLIWIAVSSFLSQENSREIMFNPDVFDSPIMRSLAIFFRLFGAVVVVAVMEELLWRSFLMRYLIKTQFLNVPVGQYDPRAFWMTVIAFTLVHRSWEWPAAVITGILYGGYLIKTKNLKGCIVAHGVTNLGLGLYVLVTKNWFLW